MDRKAAASSRTIAFMDSSLRLLYYGPPTLELLADRRRGVDLRQRARLLRLLFHLPLGDKGLGLAERFVKGAARWQRFLEEGTAEIGEVVFVGAAERGTVVARRGDDERRVVLQLIYEAAGVAGRND